MILMLLAFYLSNVLRDILSISQDTLCVHTVLFCNLLIFKMEDI